MEATIQARAEHSNSQDGFTHPNIRHSFTRRNYNWIQQLFAKASIPQDVHQEHGHSSNQAPCHSSDIALKVINETKFTLDLQSPAVSKNLFERMHIVREFYGGECANLNDLTTVIKNYMEPLRLFKILEPIEVHQIFYTIDKISPFFEDLITSLSEVIETCQGVPPIGKVFLKWLGIAQHRCPVSGTSQSQPANVLSSSEDGIEKFSPMVEAIIDYTAHLYEARECHEAICKHKPEFTDFLTRCNSTTFSKRLDLWHFLDCPRRRITRYPLLFGRLLNLVSKCCLVLICCFNNLYSSIHSFITT
ncbi:hypothetical protein PHET_08869 [Paragonimus heterotremus]|uniref:DH domain-containing protein n=1 Tax=Paragonimus heterotremus TaxID=100268 RepID=A0A8J4TC97_9TREM|nr:hypothetical protein PHET_08869 [Paragonimus heterotremus]